MSSLPDYFQALARALGGVEPLPGREEVEVHEAAGRVLADAVTADRDLPPFDRAERDGYALRGAEVGRLEAWTVIGNVAAGEPADIEVPPGHCVAIATGAPLPPDVDTVIQHELSDRGNPVGFSVKSVRLGEAVHPRGADAGAGRTLIAPFTRLGPHHAGLAAAVGRERLAVVSRPRTTVLTSGDEVVGVGEAVQPHTIRNSNGPLLSQLLARFGADLVGADHLRDDRQATIEAMDLALGRSDLVVTVGGLSAGERDHFPAAFEALGVSTLLHGASIQPGKPIFVGRHPRGAMVVGLPGNPVSVLACACLFAWPIVRGLLGLESRLPWRRVELAEPVRPNPRRRAFRPARLVDEGAGVVVPKWAGSGDLAHTAPTDGLLELPVGSDEVQPGTRLRFLPWP